MNGSKKPSRSTARQHDMASRLHDQDRVCAEGYLPPLFSHQGGVLSYRMQYVVDSAEFKMH